VNVILFSKFGPEGMVTLDLPANGSLSSENVLDELFGFQGAGAVGVYAASQSASDRFLVNGEVYTDSPNGQYKTVVNTDLSDVVDVGKPAYSPGIYVDSWRRTNAGCFNLGSRDVNVTVNVLASDGAIVGSQPLFLGANSWNQISIPNSVSAGTLKFET